MKQTQKHSQSHQKQYYREFRRISDSFILSGALNLWSIISMNLPKMGEPMK